MPRVRPLRPLLAGLVVLALPAALLAQATERVLYVSAIDTASQQAPDTLQPDDIRITEDGRAREILRVTPASTPMPVAVVVDNQARAQSTIADLRTALTAFLKTIDGLGPVAIITVADRPTIVQDYTTDQQRLQQAANRVFAQPDSGATLLDALQEVSRGLRRREEDRAAIVVVTTELTEFSTLHFSQVLEAMRDAAVSLHAVVLQNPAGSIQTDPGRNRAVVLDRGVIESGGQRIDVLASIGYTQALGRIAEALTHQFRVTYARPQQLIPPERIVVEARRDGLTVFGAPARGQQERK